MRSHNRVLISTVGGLLLAAGTAGMANANLVAGLLGQPPPPQPSAGPATPPPPPDSGSGRRVVYSNPGQRVWLVEANGRVTRSYAVSGRQGMPSPGNYSVFSKSRVSRSASGSLKLEYMVRFAQGTTLPIGFHAIPTRASGDAIQSEAELGQFRSAGCVRQRKADAAFLWDWAPVGISVVVI